MKKSFRKYICAKLQLFRERGGLFSRENSGHITLAAPGTPDHEDGRRESGGKIQEREGTEGSGEFVEEGVDNQGDKRRRYSYAGQSRSVGPHILDESVQ